MKNELLIFQSFSWADVIFTPLWNIPISSPSNINPLKLRSVVFRQIELSCIFWIFSGAEFPFYVETFSYIQENCWYTHIKFYFVLLLNFKMTAMSEKVTLVEEIYSKVSVHIRRWGFKQSFRPFVSSRLPMYQRVEQELIFLSFFVLHSRFRSSLQQA